MSDLLTARFANETGFRVLEQANDSAVIRELEIVVSSEMSRHAPDRYGVDGILSGSILVHGDRLLLTWRLSCLIEESVKGGWHELETAALFDAGFEHLSARLAPAIEQWAGQRRLAYAQESNARAERLASLPSLAGRPVVLRIREQTLHGQALDGGVSIGSVIEICRKAGLSVRSPAAPGDVPDALYIDGLAQSDAPLYRAGRSLARASCTLRMRDGDNPVPVAEATAARIFAASAPREAVNAALAGAGEDAALELLNRYAERMRDQALDPAERLRADRVETPREPRVAIDINDDHDDRLRAMQDLAALALNDNPRFIPVIRELVDASARAGAGRTAPSPVGALQVPATYAIVLSRIQSDVFGHLLDTRTGELLDMTMVSLANGYGAAAQDLIDAMSRAIDAHVTDRQAPVRWVALGSVRDIDAGPVSHGRITHWMLRRLLHRQDVRVLVRDLSWVVARERGLGLPDVNLWKCDAEVGAELARGRKDNTAGLWLSMMLRMAGDGVAHEEILFLPTEASATWDWLVGETLDPLLRHVALRPGVVSESQTQRFAIFGRFLFDYIRGPSATAQRLVEYAVAEGEARRTEDWYRLYPGSHDDRAISALEVNRIRNQHEPEPEHRIGPVVRARAARLMWEAQHGRVRGLDSERIRMHDRSVVIQAWVKWLHVPLHDARQLLDAYLMAYHRYDDPPTIRCPDLMLAGGFLTAHPWHSPAPARSPPVPEHHIRSFFDGMARAECDGMRLLSRDGDALHAVLNFHRVTPEAYAAGAMHLLTTSNAYAVVVALPRTEVWSGLTSDALILTHEMHKIMESFRRFSRTPSAQEMRDERNFPHHSVALREQLLDYLRSAPRPLPLPVRHLLGKSMRVRFLGDAVRPEDPLPPYVEAPPVDTAAATSAEPAPLPADTWSLHRVPVPKQWRQISPTFTWVTGLKFYQGSVSRDQLTLQWLDVSTGETGVPADVVQSLTDAPTLVAEQIRHFAFDGDHYLNLFHALVRIETNGSLVRLPRLPGMSNRGITCGIGTRLVTAVPGRLQIWDRETDTLRDVAHYQSTRPGGLNNRTQWNIVHFRPVLETGQVEAVLLGSLPPTERGGGSIPHIEHWSVDPVSGQTILLRRERLSEILNTRRLQVVDTRDGFLIPMSNWHLMPRAADLPIMPLPKLLNWGADSRPVVGNQRAISVKRNWVRLPPFGDVNATGTTKSVARMHANLIMLDEFDTGGLSTVRIAPSADDAAMGKALHGQLFRVQDDLLIVNPHGPFRIPNVFTRVLPPDGSEIRIVMIQENSKDGE